MKLLESLDALDSWASRADSNFADTPYDIDRGIAALDTARLHVVRNFAAACRYEYEHADALFSDQMAYLHRLRSWTQPVRALNGLRQSRARLFFVPYRLSLVSLPSNAVVPLAAIFVTCCELLRARVILTGSQSQRDLILELLNVIAPSDRVAFWGGRTREIIPHSIERRVIDHLYFLGSSELYPALAANCARSDILLRFEGQGDGLAYVSETADLNAAAALLVRAKSFCEGRMCSAPSGVLIAKGLQSDFVEVFNSVAERTRLYDSLGESVRSRQWEESLDRHLRSDWRTLRRPALVPLSTGDGEMLGEAYSPVAWCAECSTITEAISVIERNRFRLQVSYFGNDEAELDRILAIRFARYCVNMNPADQDPILPWGNFGRSGESPVEEFVNKFGSWRLIEGGLGS